MDSGGHGLKRELRLWDLVAMQVVLIVWLGWTGFAAKQGSSQIVLWLLAIVLFYIPLAAVVMKLSRAMPVEGCTYAPVDVANPTVFALKVGGVIIAANGVGAYCTGGGRKN